MLDITPEIIKKPEIKKTHNKHIEKLEEKLLFYLKKAVYQYQMIKPNDKVMVCLSGGKDSYTMLYLLKKLQLDRRYNFDLVSFTLDQSQPGWNDNKMRQWLEDNNIDYVIKTENTYSIVTDKIPENKTYCSLCSRLRRGIIYKYATENKFDKIALGHHRDDLITSLFMSILYNGQIKSMPPKLLTDNKKNIIIRPLVFCQEKDIATFAVAKGFPIIPCNLCGSQTNLKRVETKKLINQLAKDNPKIPSNILHALQSLQPSQLMDQNRWDFKHLEENLLTD